jgi:steroid delta-isomerase-like uncharacterized protein
MSQTLELVTAFYDRIWNAADESAAGELLQPDFRFRGSLGVECAGTAEFAQYVRSVRTSLADYRCEMVEAVEADDRCFARMRFTGRHIAEFLGVPATGRTVTWEGAALFHIADGRIRQAWVLGDVDGLKAQLQ